MRRRGAAFAAASLAPGPARAHAFATGQDASGAILDGVGVVLASPVLLLPVLALAVALALWQSDGLVRAWPHFLIGTLVGMAAAPYAGSWAAVLPMGLGLVVAALAALAPLDRLGPALPLLAGLAGFATLLAALEGHGWADVPLPTRLGILIAAHATLAVAAGLVAVSRARIAHPLTTTLWRIVASWLAAILLLYLAFMLKG